MTTSPNTTNSPSSELPTYSSRLVGVLVRSNSETSHVVQLSSAARWWIFLERSVSIGGSRYDISARYGKPL